MGRTGALAATGVVVFAAGVLGAQLRVTAPGADGVVWCHGVCGLTHGPCPRDRKSVV